MFIVKVINWIHAICCVTIFIISCYVFLNTNAKDMNYIPTDTEITFSYYSIFIFVIIGFIQFLFALVTVMSVCQLLEFKNNNQAEYFIDLLKVFSACKLIGLLLFLLITGFSLLFGDVISKSHDLSESTCKTGQLKDVNNAFLKLQDIWCKSKHIETEEGVVDVGCGCYINDYSIWSEEDQKQLRNKNEYSNIKSSEYLGVSRVQDCKIYETLKSQYREQMMIIQSLENEYKCSGICEGDIIYYFKSVSESIPQSKLGCFYFVIEKTKEIISNFQLWTKACFYSSIFDGLIILCYHKLLSKIYERLN